jgi:hypothetical protein
MGTTTGASPSRAARGQCPRGGPSPASASRRSLTRPARLLTLLLLKLASRLRRLTAHRSKLIRRGLILIEPAAVVAVVSHELATRPHFGLGVFSPSLLDRAERVFRKREPPPCKCLGRCPCGDLSLSARRGELLPDDLPELLVGHVVASSRARAGATEAAALSGAVSRRSRAGRRTTTQLLAGTGAGALLSTTDASARSRPPRTPARRGFFGGMRRTATGEGGGGGGGLMLVGGSTRATAGAVSAARAGRAGRRARRAGMVRSPSASRTLAKASFRTRPTRSATKAVTVASICVVMLIAPGLHNSGALVNGSPPRWASTPASSLASGAGARASLSPWTASPA